MKENKQQEKICNDLEIIFRGNEVKAWREISNRESFLEEILKKFPPLWSLFFRRVIEPHFYRGQQYIFDTLMTALEYYREGLLDDDYVDFVRDAIEEEENDRK